jgi:hypothetical protein
MAEANFNMVRLAEFVWSKIEPNEGHYDGLLPLINPMIPALTYDRLTWGSRITFASRC